MRNKYSNQYVDHKEFIESIFSKDGYYDFTLQVHKRCGDGFINLDFRHRETEELGTITIPFKDIKKFATQFITNKAIQSDLI